MPVAAKKDPDLRVAVSRMIERGAEMEACLTFVVMWENPEYGKRSVTRNAHVYVGGRSYALYFRVSLSQIPVVRGLRWFLDWHSTVSICKHRTSTEPPD